MSLYQDPSKPIMTRCWRFHRFNACAMKYSNAGAAYDLGGLQIALLFAKCSLVRVIFFAAE